VLVVLSLGEDGDSDMRTIEEPEVRALLEEPPLRLHRVTWRFSLSSMRRISIFYRPLLVFLPGFNIIIACLDLSSRSSSSSIEARHGSGIAMPWQEGGRSYKM
jgi:hypothetical protein